MAANGISTLSTKELRQVAKLELAQTKRQLTGTQGYRENRYYDLDLLPTKYSGDGIVNNPNVGGLQAGRPWKSTPNILSGLWKTKYTGYWGGDPTWFDSHSADIIYEQMDDTFTADAMNEGVSIQWVGYFNPTVTANYTFYMISDDESRVWVGANAITGYTTSNNIIYADSNSNNPGGEVVSNPILLTAGEYYPIRVQYGNVSNGSYAFFAFSWSNDA
jgi:hypothetical protein